MKLNALMDNAGARPSKKRVGRGIGSGLGKTSGRGHKGQKARAGASGSATFEGGQTPIFKRLPMVGFKNPFSKEYATVNVLEIEKAIKNNKLDAKKVIDAESLKSAGLIRRVKDGVKILGVGTVVTAINVEVVKISETAKAAIEKAGGSVKLVTKQVVAKADKAEKTVKTEKAEKAPKAEKAVKAPAKKAVAKPAAKKAAAKK